MLFQALSREQLPALQLLDLWEAINAGSERAVLDLLQTLRVIGRADAVHLLERCIAECGEDHPQLAQPISMPKCPPAPFCSLNVSPEESRDELRGATSE